MKMMREMEVLGVNLPPLYSPQTLHVLTWDPTWTTQWEADNSLSYGMGYVKMCD
jgi:hypothetical protein